MYSWEIEKFLSERNYNISSDEYGIVCDIKNNPQINWIKYDAFNNCFHMSTSDGYHWTFRIWRNKYED